MTLFEGLPDELLLRIFKDHELQPHELQVISSLSKRIRRAALDDSIWRRICHVIMSGCSLLGDEEDVQLTKWGAQSFYDLWVSLLRQWSSFIGFWVASPSRDIIYIAPCNTRGAILVANLDLTNAFKPDPKDNLRFRVRSIARSEYRYPLYIQTADMLIHATEEDTAGSVFLNGVISVGLYVPHYKVLRTDFYGLLQQGDGSAVVPFSPTTFQRSVVRSDWIGGLGRPPRQRVCPGLMPSPAMAPIIRSLVHTGNEVEFPCLQCWNYSRHSKYIPLEPPKRTDIHASPSALNILDYPSNLIDSGLFAGPYKDSLELFYITVRTLTEKDFYKASASMARDPDGAIPFNSSRPLLDDIPPEYHWEGTFAHDDSTPHLGPFSRGYSPNPHISVGSVKPGQRIIEAVRIHGNLDLPRGQRAFIGFLDIPSDSYNTSSASSDAREAITEFDGVINRHSEGSIPTEAANNEFRSLMEKYGLPPTTHRNQFNPWPIRRLEGQGTSGSTTAQRGSHRVVALSDSEMMAPGEGWTTRGVMRIADRSIQNPRWTSCDIHFESRRELLVCRPGYVTTFKHLECFSLAA